MEILLLIFYLRRRVLVMVGAGTRHLSVYLTLGTLAVANTL